MGNREIEGSFTPLPPSGFFTRAKAAFAIATQLYPDEKGRRADAVDRLGPVIYNALCSGQLVGRDPDLHLPIAHPDTRLPIGYRNLAGAIALSGCLISEADLNEWLAVIGIGVRVRDSASVPDDTPLGNPALGGLPSDEELLLEQEEVKRSGVTDCNKRLGKKYNVKARTIKDACTKARKASKAPKVSTSSVFPSSRYKGSSS
ncbi:hypothetical protein GCM10027093_11240 [Paraburkholderia jirisanensis]